MYTGYNKGKMAIWLLKIFDYLLVLGITTSLIEFKYLFVIEIVPLSFFFLK